DSAGGAYNHEQPVPSGLGPEVLRVLPHKPAPVLPGAGALQLPGLGHSWISVTPTSQSRKNNKIARRTAGFYLFSPEYQISSCFFADMRIYLYCAFEKFGKTGGGPDFPEIQRKSICTYKKGG
ncbi:MAG: hypothetical protein II794_07850, partial [Oscillospiraceae bacterium]|nr:hypothetical protein [Oscillospiraceae bacterium]